jgi:hypothetical protein
MEVYYEDEPCCMKERDQKIRLAYNKFAYTKTKNDSTLRGMFQKKMGQFAIAFTRIHRQKDRKYRGPPVPNYS